jgi:hypothetical protein
VVTVGTAMRIGDPDGGSGKLNVNGGTLNVTSSITSLGAITMAGGSISASQLLLDGGSLGGAGTINAPVDAGNVNVTVKPGAAGNFAGLLNVNGTYTQDGPADTGATLEMQLGGDRKSFNDRLVVSGAASLGGTLRVLLINGYVPPIDAEFTLVSAASVSETFDAVELPALSPGREWELTYNAKSVVLRVNFTGTCEGDGNGDSLINIDDLLLVINGWGVCPAGLACPADIAPWSSGDGFVNVDDLLVVISHWQ